MTTLLVNDGWIINANTQDEEFFPWTNKADVVDEGDEILVDMEVVANTLGGDDIITGTGGDLSIDNFGKIETENGNDIIKGTDGIIFGIFNRSNSKIETGNGNDIIEGTSTNSIGISSFSDNIIDTGNGNDTITGTGDFGGIRNISNSMIETGNGQGTITGTGDIVGILNISNSMIETGNGQDTITGTGDIVGIFNTSDSMIETGNGQDIVEALTVDAFTGDPLIGVFDGGGTVNLGRGEDLIRGFGEQSVFGGQGMDTAELGIDYDVDLLSLGSSFDIKIGEMEFTDVETFVFNDETFSLQDLQGEVV